MENIRLVTAADTIDPALQAHCRFIRYFSERFPLHRHDFYEIFLIAKGKILHQANGKQELLPEGSLCFIRPCDCHFYLPSGEGDCLYINFKFQAELFESFVDFYSLASFKETLLSAPDPPVRLLGREEKEALCRRFEQLNAVPAGEKERLNLFIRRLLADLVLDYFYEEKAKAPPLPDWFSSLLAHLEKDRNFLKGTSELAAFSGKNPAYLSRCFRRFLGVTPVEYLNRLRLSYAANLLRNTDIPIIDVSLECGFYSLSHFYKLFKSAYGVTAARYRKGGAGV